MTMAGCDCSAVVGLVPVLEEFDAGVLDAGVPDTGLVQLNGGVPSTLAISVP